MECGLAKLYCTESRDFFHFSQESNPPTVGLLTNCNRQKKFCKLFIFCIDIRKINYSALTKQQGITMILETSENPKLNLRRLRRLIQIIFKTVLKC